MLFIYRFDGRSPNFGAADTIFRKLPRLGYSLMSSLFVQGELLVHPLRNDDQFTAARVNNLFASETIDLVAFDSEAMHRYAALRAATRVKPLDALHLACAARGGADIFVTNDTKLHSLQVPGLGRIVGLDPVQW